jgi:hypothetical protein
MCINRAIASRILSAALMSSALSIGPAFAQSAPNSRDACTSLQPAGKYCVTPAKDAAEAISQLFTQESNALVDNPIEFATLYRAVFSQFINTQIGSLTQGSSLAAFSFIRDPTTGALQVKSNTFGPLFSERPQTAGRRAFGFAVTTQGTTFESQDGTSLSEQGIVNDYIFGPGRASQRYTSTFSVTTRSTAFGAVIGVTDKLDFSVSVPFVRTTVAGRTAYDWSSPAGIPDPTYVTDVRGTSTGLGDISLRGKYNFRNSTTDQWAVLLEQRLPTGDEDRLLGFGKGQTKVALLMSGTAGRLSPHGTVGYTRAGKGVALGDLNLTGADLQTFRISGGTVEQSDEINYAGGVAAEVHPRVTLAGELIGRTLKNSVQLDSVSRVAPGGAVRTISFFREAGSLHLFIGTIGGKFNVSGDWLVIANVLFPLNDTGLKMGVTPVIGLQKVFSGR